MLHAFSECNSPLSRKNVKGPFPNDFLYLSTCLETEAFLVKYEFPKTAFGGRTF